MRSRLHDTPKAMHCNFVSCPMMELLPDHWDDPSGQDLGTEDISAGFLWEVILYMLQGAPNQRSTKRASSKMSKDPVRYTRHTWGTRIGIVAITAVSVFTLPRPSSSHADPVPSDLATPHRITLQYLLMQRPRPTRHSRLFPTSSSSTHLMSRRSGCGRLRTDWA